jgi:hypothetical protein
MVYDDYYVDQAGEGVDKNNAIDFEDYYVKQAGTGMTSFNGMRYQKGNGFFGRLIKGLKPLLSYFGKKALKTTANVASDMLEGGDFKTVLKKNLGVSAKDMAADAVAKMKSMTGGGVKRKMPQEIVPTKKRKLSQDPKNVKARAKRAALKLLNTPPKKKPGPKRTPAKKGKAKAKAIKGPKKGKTIKGTEPKTKAIKGRRALDKLPADLIAFLSKK